MLFCGDSFCETCASKTIRGNTLTCLICGVIHTITHQGNNICANEDIVKVSLTESDPKVGEIDPTKKKSFPKADLNLSQAQILAMLPDNTELIETMKASAV